MNSRCPAKSDADFFLRALRPRDRRDRRDLIQRFGRDRNVRAIGDEVLKSPSKLVRREAGEGPVIYRT